MNPKKERERKTKKNKGPMTPIPSQKNLNKNRENTKY